MLAPRASNAFVCIRCELQLARRRLPAYPRHTPHANFSTSTRRQDGADELEALSSAPTPGMRIKREVQPLDRIRKRKGKVIRETSARLGDLKLLGDDAEILVLREVGGSKPAVEVPVKPAPAEPVVVPDILASLQQEKGTLTPEEIHKRLESLRPQVHAEPDEPLYVPLKAFVKIIRDLTNGFTQQQLSQFYSARKNVQQDQFRAQMLASLKAESGTSGIPVARTRTSWQPGTTPITKRLPGVDVSRNKRVPISKQLLVDRIIRDLWNLVPLEEVEAPGEIELSLKPWQITLLDAGEDKTLLDQISGARKAKIEIHHPHSILRITADKTTAEYAANDIEEALKNIERKKMHLKAWIPCLKQDKVPKDQKLTTLYTDEDFQMVTSLTSASIQRMDNANTLAIKGLDKFAVDEAERALIRLLPLKDSILRTIDTKELDVTNGLGRLLPASYDEKSLDFKHRSTKLGRWSLPVVRQNHSVRDMTDETIEKSAARQRQVASVVKSLRDAAKDGPSALSEPVLDGKLGIWHVEPTFKLSVEFGQVLYPQVGTVAEGTPQDDRTLLSQPVFTPSVPGLMSLLGAAHIQGASETEPSSSFRALKSIEAPSLLYDFIAAPHQQFPVVGQVLPSLHVQMRTNDDGGATLHRLTLGFQKHIHTVLLPESAADVQFSRYGRLRLRKDHRNPHIKKWARAISENIASGERLSAPELSIGVPKWTITGDPKDVNGIKTVNYLFSGVHFRQAVIGEFQGTDVTYNTVQAGKMGAQGGSLSMYHSPEGQSAEVLLQDDSLNSFVEHSLDFVNTIAEAASQTQPVAKTMAKMLLPRNAKSSRRLRRSEDQAVAATKTEEATDDAAAHAEEAQMLLDAMSEKVSTSADHDETSEGEDRDPQSQSPSTLQS